VEKELTQSTDLAGIHKAVHADKSILAEQSDTLKFVQELAKYHMDFLETDFHRHKNPKRRVRLRSADNLLVGINLARYPAFVQAAWKFILTGFSADIRLLRHSHAFIA
jgi:hypothetical protein